MSSSAGTSGTSGAGPSGAGSSRAGPSGAGPSGAGPSRAGPSGAGQSGAGPSGAGPSGAGPSGAGPSGAGPSGAGSDAGDEINDVVLCGYLKKLKTHRKKYFVLRAESAESSAKLEYYDSERKYKAGQPPKRSIPLKTCFNINRKVDTRYKHVIALYTKDDCFSIELDSADDLDVWLKALLQLQHGGEEIIDGETPKPTFEHVWQVTVLNRGIGHVGLIGHYRLCLTDKTLSLIRKDCDVPQVEVNLTNVRSCGCLKDFLFLEVGLPIRMAIPMGRQCYLGPGEVWMQTEDANIAANVHATILNAMSSNTVLGPMTRNRSSSATESSKPSMSGRGKFSAAPKAGIILAQDVSHSTTDSQVVPPSSSSQHPIAGGDSCPANISHQRTQSLPLANPAPISDQTTSHHLSRVATGNNTKRSNQSSKCLSAGGTRERSDSMPSRARTTSEGNHVIQIWNQNRPHLNQFRPNSVYNRDISNSPPSGSPVSPPSVACSTDSTGSSYSLTDDAEAGPDLEAPLGRYGHSLTPDEVIAEEDSPDSPGLGAYGAGPSTYVPMNLHSSNDAYVAMSPKDHHHSPKSSMSSVTSGTPSTDYRFHEYPLEKVTSYFPSDEGEEERPLRAYSVGSRPETYRYKKYMDQLLNGADNRVRAFSVGSKTKKVTTRVLPPHNGHHNGPKSSSAPILNNSRMQGSHSSIGPMDDLMEMDFSRSGSVVIGGSSSSGYMEMRPRGGTAGSAVFANHNDDLRTASGYVVMKPGVGVTTSASSSAASTVTPGASSSPYVDMSSSPYVDMSSSSPSRPSYVEQTNARVATEDYVDMGRNLNNNNTTTNNANYIDMSANNQRIRRVSSDSNHVALSPARSSYQDEERTPSLPRGTPEGYVEMTPGRQNGQFSNAGPGPSTSSIPPGNHNRQSSWDGGQNGGHNEDYTNMNCGSASSLAHKQPSNKKKTRSQPIAIQKPAQSAQKVGSTSPLYSMVGRKFSSGTPPTHLPLSNFSSLPRSRTSSKDSSSSSLTTPSSSSTIFHLSLSNACSPSSPVKPVEIKVPPSVLHTEYKKAATPQKTENISDYLAMDFGGRTSHIVTAGPSTSQPAPTTNSDDYVNFEPGEATRFRPIRELEVDEQARSGGDGNRSSGSRPNSASSELYSSSGCSTVVGNSRPDSVNSDRVRPVSVADLQLHYASLDLDDGNRSPRTVKSDTSQAQAEPSLTYAAIDFVKSEEMRQNSKKH